MRIEQVIQRLQANLDTSCWDWTGALFDTGYGAVRYEGETCYVHRVVFEHFNGKMDEGLCIDHLCRNRKCANPEHLEAVTQRENNLRGESNAAENARKTHCIQGHPFSGDNLLIYRQGQERVCRECKREREKTSSKKYRDSQRSKRNDARSY